MANSGILKSEESALLIIDVQDRLMPVIHESERVFSNCNKLIAGMAVLGVQRLVTEQYPKGLGHTVTEVPVDGIDVVEKISFSCMQHKGVQEHLAGKRSLILCGVEAHVCVLKTALDALEMGYEVHVVADAVSSRTQKNYELGLARMRQSGVFVASTEMILFQLMDIAGTAQFKEIAKLIR